MFVYTVWVHPYAYKQNVNTNISNDFPVQGDHLVSQVWDYRREGSGFSRPDPTLRRKRNHLEQPFGFPSSMRVHVTQLTSKRQITSLFLLLKETLGTLRYNDAAATRTSKNNNRFNKQTRMTLFCTFRYCFCTTTT